MRIKHWDSNAHKKSVMGIFNNVNMIDCNMVGREEVMYLSQETFDMLAGVLDGFLQLCNNSFPVVKEEVNEVLNKRNCEVKYVKLDNLGFYHYKIKFGEREIEFAIEPDLIQLYNYCINDMMRRHRKSPAKSYVSNELKNMKTCMTDLDAAIAPKSPAADKELKSISDELKRIVDASNNRAPINHSIKENKYPPYDGSDSV